MSFTKKLKKGDLSYIHVLVEKKNERAESNLFATNHTIWYLNTV